MTQSKELGKFYPCVTLQIILRYIWRHYRIYLFSIPRAKKPNEINA